jgi:3-isopropylmalate/(R)-2-methylmalate dehydratase small subunit
MEPFKVLRSRTVVLAIDDIDTDQLCPARFLTATTREGMGRCLFADWRYGSQGEPRADFALNREEAAGAQVLVAGHNFGCGSSREHAVWALLDAGFRAVVSTGFADNFGTGSSREHAPWALRSWGIGAILSTSFADIFRNNALKNGLLPVQIDPEAHARLGAQPGAEIVVDLEASLVRMADGSLTPFSVEPFARHCLLAGMDKLDFLLSQEEAIAEFEQARERGSRA